MAAELAHAVRTEVEAAFGNESLDQLASSRLLKDMSHAHCTGHAGSGTRAALDAIPNLVADLRVCNMDIGLASKHPCILPSDYVRSLAAHGTSFQTLQEVNQCHACKDFGKK